MQNKKHSATRIAFATLAGMLFTLQMSGCGDDDSSATGPADTTIDSTPVVDTSDPLDTLPNDTIPSDTNTPPATATWFTVGYTDSHIQYSGRVRDYSNQAEFSWSGTSASLTFRGTAIKAILTSPGSWYKVFVDGTALPDLSLEDNSDTVHTLVEGLTYGEHTVELYKRTEVQVGTGTFKGFQVLGDTALPAPVSKPVRRIEFIGNSITCGYGNLDSVKENHFAPATEDHWYTYAAVTARTLGAEEHAVCWSGRGIYRNNDNSTDGTLPQLWELTNPDATEAWDFSSWTPDLVVINLGTNDFYLAPPPDSAAFEATSLAFLQRIRQVYPGKPIILLDGPMLSDYFPTDPETNKPVQSLTLVKKHLNNLVAQMSAAGEDSVYHLSFYPNSSSRGYGADWHPNIAQGALNADQLVTYIRSNLGW